MQAVGKEIQIFIWYVTKFSTPSFYYSIKWLLIKKKSICHIHKSLFSFGNNFTFVTSLDFSKLVRGVSFHRYVSVTHEESDGNITRMCRRCMRRGGHKNNQETMVAMLWPWAI